MDHTSSAAPVQGYGPISFLAVDRSVHSGCPARSPPRSPPRGAQVIRRLLSNGTTCAQLFATVHLEPCLLLADLLEQAGMRAFLGKVQRGWMGVWGGWGAGMGWHGAGVCGGVGKGGRGAGGKSRSVGLQGGMAGPPKPASHLPCMLKSERRRAPYEDRWDPPAWLPWLQPCMDRHTPPGALESTEQAVADTEALIRCAAPSPPRRHRTWVWLHAHSVLLTLGCRD